MDLIVIGGGVMGAGVAWQCAARGMSVTILDAPHEGPEASWAAAGMLAPTAEVQFYEDTELALGEASQRLWPEFAAEVQDAAGDAIGYDTAGSIVVAIDRDETEALGRVYDYQVTRGLPVERWTGDQCREREPLLSPRVHSGVWCPQDHQVDAWMLTEAIRKAAVGAGATLREDAKVAAVRIANGATVGVTLESGETVDAKRVLVAAGAWSRGLAGLEQFTPPVRPVKGQMVSLNVDPAFRLTHVIRAVRAYVAPKDAQWVIGATSEERGFDARVTAGGVWQLLDGAYEVVPSVLELEMADTWCGFRPACRDNGPILGGCDVDGLFFCTGHYRHGIQQSAISVKGVSAAILGEDTPKEMAPFAISRFVS